MKSMITALKSVFSSATGELVALAVVLTIFLIPRFMFLEADPPENYLGSYGVYFTDEGYRSYAARDKALFHLPFSTISRWNHTPVPAPLFAVQYAVFSVAGVGLWQARLITVLFSFGCMLLVYRIARACFGRSISMIVLIMAGTDSTFFFDNRVALTETPLLFFLLLAAYFFVKSKSGKPYLQCFAGISCCVAYLIKPHALPFVAAYVLALFIEAGRHWRLAARGVAFFASGMVVSAGLAVSCMFLTGSNQVFINTALSESGARFDAVPTHLLANLSSFPNLAVYDKAPVLAFCAVSYVFIFLYNLVSQNRKPHWLEFLVFFWIVFHSLAIAVFHYQPLRYFLPLLPAVCFGCAFLLQQALEFEVRRHAVKVGIFSVLSIAATFLILRYVFPLSNDDMDLAWKQNFILKDSGAALCLCIVFVAIGLLVFKRGKGLNRMALAPLLSLTALFVFLISFVLVRDGPMAVTGIGLWNAKNSLPYCLFQAAAIPLLCLPFIGILFVGANRFRRTNKVMYPLIALAVLWNVFPYMQWLKAKELSLSETSRRIGALTGDKGVLFSRAATSLCFQNKLYAINDIADLPGLLPVFDSLKVPLYVAVTTPAEYGMFGDVMEKQLIPMGVKGAEFLYKTVVFRNYYECSCFLFKCETANGPRDTTLKHGCADVLTKTHSVDDEIDYCTRVLQTSPDCVEAHFRLANALVEWKKYDEASFHYRQVIRIRPDHAPALNNYAAALIEQGALDSAREQLELAVFANPLYAQAYLNLSLVMDGLGYKKGSRLAYGKAMFLRSHAGAKPDPDALFHALQEFEIAAGRRTADED
jgi:tetratricopeptide (TPR) repeat protein